MYLICSLREMQDEILWAESSFTKSCTSIPSADLISTSGVHTGAILLLFCTAINGDDAQIVKTLALILFIVFNLYER